jgi:hypothetical protein
MHFIRDLVHDRIIDFQFCPSSKQTVDIFTKTFTEHKWGGFVPMWFSLFPHFYSVFISYIVHEYLIWPSRWDSFFTP